MSDSTQKSKGDISDALLPVVEVARRLGVSTSTVVQHIQNRGLRSLDEGQLVVSGDHDTPLIRERELRRFVSAQLSLAKSSPRPLTTEKFVENEPLLAAYALVTSLQEGNDELTWNASSEASHAALKTQKALAQWWYDYLEIAEAPEPGVASGLHPVEDGVVAVKYIADTPPSGGIMAQWTLVYAKFLAIVQDPAGWRVDQPMQERYADWVHLVTGDQTPDGSSG